MNKKTEADNYMHAIFSFSLTELHLSLNELNEIRVSPPGAVHSGITDLYINSAAIDNTSNTLCHLGIAFPQLENLVLIGNPFQQFASECSILQESFPKLKSLNISETGLCQWEEVEKLRHLPALTSLRITGLEFMEVRCFSIFVYGKAYVSM